MVERQRRPEMWMEVGRLTCECVVVCTLTGQTGASQLAGPVEYSVFTFGYGAMVKVSIIGKWRRTVCSSACTHLLILTTTRLQMKNKFTCAFSSSVCAKYSSAILSAQTLQCSRGRAGLDTSAHFISILQSGSTRFKKPLTGKTTCGGSSETPAPLGSAQPSR